MFEKIYRPLVIALLIILIVVQIIGVVQTGQHNAQLEKKAAICKIATDLVSGQLSTIPTTYKNDVYNNPQVDNINKQIFTQGEYQLNVMQMIALIEASCN